MEESREETELPNRMADLGLIEMDDPPEGNSKPPESTARVLRKRKSLAPEIVKSSNRRVSMKPRKHVITENASPKEIEALYMNKKVKASSHTLETIYEEPKTDTDETLINGRKVKRLLVFQSGNQYTKEKIKKRRAKIKANQFKSFLNRKKIPMKVFLQSIECLELDEVVKTDVTNITIGT